LQPPQWSVFDAVLAQIPPHSSSGAVHSTDWFGGVGFDGVSDPEQAAKHPMVTRMEPRRSHRRRERSLKLDDRMGEPFMMFL